MSKKPQKSHGGSRPGAGRKPLPAEEKLTRKTFACGNERWERATKAAEKSGLTIGHWLRNLIDKATH